MRWFTGDTISFQISKRFGKAEGNHVISLSVGNGTNSHAHLLQQKDPGRPSEKPPDRKGIGTWDAGRWGSGRVLVRCGLKCEQNRSLLVVTHRDAPALGWRASSDGLWSPLLDLFFCDSLTEGKRQLMHWPHPCVSEGEFHVELPNTEKSQGEKLNYNCAHLPNGPISRPAFRAAEVTGLAIIFRKNIIYLKTTLAVHCRY